MGHRIYVDEQLTPAEFDETIDYNILSALDRAEIESESHCRAGFCGTCRVTLLRGQIAMGGEPRMCAKVKFCPVAVYRPPI